MKRLLAACAALLLCVPALAQNPRVELKTSRGPIVLELYADKAPRTVGNFLQYVRSGHYDGTLFHRVIDGFMIQGGGLDRDMKEKPVRAPIQNEAANRLENDTGTVAMARTPNPHSATAQFFINLKGNDFLNFRDPSPQGYGYAVFGRVVQGMDVVNSIAKVRTRTVGGQENVPAEPILIQAATVLGADKDK
jgi:cyclophilin family peptidyl-prolyl cis-trans isomerase